MDSLTARFQKEVFLPYLDLLKSGYRFHPVFGHAKKMWEEKLTADELVNGPYLEKSQIYQEGPALDGLPLHEKTKSTIRKRLDNRGLWKHQTDALQIILNGMNAVIATGTSSGKTLCYQIPILDDLVRDPAPGLRAVIIYPLNALVNDQLTEWEQMLADHPQIRFARFTGQTPNTQSDYVAVLRTTFREDLSDQGLTQQELQQKVEQRLAEKLRTDIPNRLNHREDIRANPPQVLITNFSMLEYLLERPVDAPIFENARLKFLVLDEAHAYRGVQATEIAFLVRRIKDRLNLDRLVCIATSATLGKQGDAESQMKVRKFASDLFGEEFDNRNPIYGTAAEPLLRQPSFPSLLEQETFSHDMGRKIIGILDREKKRLSLVELGEFLADEEEHDQQFFLPVSRLPDEEPDQKARRNLWLAETFAYFGVPDSARESAEDLGLVAVEYQIRDNEKSDFRKLLGNKAPTTVESDAVLQTLLGYMRQRNAFTLPKSVDPRAPAFGLVPAVITYVERRQGIKNTNGWLPHGNKDNAITDYLRRALSCSRDDAYSLAENIWKFLVSQSLLIEYKGGWKLDHERIFLTRPPSRYVCNRCGIITAYSAKNCCPKKSCEGILEPRPFDPTHENIIAHWVSGGGERQFFTLKSEEHTAQINKDLAKAIEDEFRAEGINLLSSTTTFEMGINIGDLQKVLLRNAPPSSASYVQRVGRAGRGRDKNSVCVTLCRRTKYDADAWINPPRLMSGEVRTPTVFTENKVISQRHFGAVVFAKFLRIKVVDERSLGQIKQQIRLESFLPIEARVGIPDGWFQIRPTSLYLDFLEWLNQQKDAEILQTAAGRSLLHAIGGFNAGVASAAKNYQSVRASIADELSALVAEREKLHKLGGQVSDVEHAIKNLLGSDIIAILAKRGFLPRYAFPLDVVTLETGRTRWSRDADVELSRDRGIAIAEFAPGAQVIAHKKVFTSAGLYVVSKMDAPRKEYFSECPSCKQIRTAGTQDKLTGPCTVCQKPITTSHIKLFVSPSAFSVRVDDKSTVRYRRSTLIRQRQSLTHFIDHVDESSFQDRGQFRLALKETGTLFRYNSGPENKGFMLCPVCGCSEPLRGYKAGKKHRRLRPITGVMECGSDKPWTKELAYGHQFQSYCLIARPTVTPGSIESLAYALQRGLCLALDLESSDIGVSWRWLAHKKDRTGSEIILYDQTPGGAGFVKEGFDNWEGVTRAAMEICDKCTCERACYGCLKSYSNQSQHERLNRLSISINFQ